MPLTPTFVDALAFLVVDVFFVTVEVGVVRGVVEDFFFFLTVEVEVVRLLPSPLLLGAIMAEVLAEVDVVRAESSRLGSVGASGEPETEDTDIVELREVGGGVFGGGGRGGEEGGEVSEGTLKKRS